MSTARPMVMNVLLCRAFLMLAGSREAAVQCRILRDKSSKLYPKYQLVLESDTCFLMSARKRKKSKSSNYILSFDEEDTARFSANFAGKVRANFLGTEFTVYDKGQKPQKAGHYPTFSVCALPPVAYFSVMHKPRCVFHFSCFWIASLSSFYFVVFQ